MNYSDFDITAEGNSVFMKEGESDHSLSHYLSVSPSFIELDEGESKEVVLTLQIPDDYDANRAFWGVVMLEEEKRKKNN